MVTATRPSANGHLAGPTPLHAILPQTKTTPRQPKTASQQAWERFAKAHELAPTIKPHRYQPDCWLVPSASRDGDYALRIDHAPGHHPRTPRAPPPPPPDTPPHPPGDRAPPPPPPPPRPHLQGLHRRPGQPLARS